MKNIENLNNSNLEVRSFFVSNYGFKNDTSLRTFINKLQSELGNRVVWQDIANEVLNICGVTLHEVLQAEFLDAQQMQVSEIQLRKIERFNTLIDETLNPNNKYVN